RYMAPERFEGRCDARSDVYALGLTLYELLALRPAFEKSDRAELIRRVTHEEPPRLRSLDPTIPRDLETVVHKAIEREPARRYADAQALAADLRRVGGGGALRGRRARAPGARLAVGPAQPGRRGGGGGGAGPGRAVRRRGAVGAAPAGRAAGRGGLASRSSTRCGDGVDGPGGEPAAAGPLDGGAGRAEAGRGPTERRQCARRARAPPTGAGRAGAGGQVGEQPDRPVEHLRQQGSSRERGQ